MWFANGVLFGGIDIFSSGGSSFDRDKLDSNEWYQAKMSVGVEVGKKSLIQSIARILVVMYLLPVVISHPNIWILAWNE